MQQDDDACYEQTPHEVEERTQQQDRQEREEQTRSEPHGVGEGEGLELRVEGGEVESIRDGQDRGELYGYEQDGEQEGWVRDDGEDQDRAEQDQVVSLVEGQVGIDSLHRLVQTIWGLEWTYEVIPRAGFLLNSAIASENKLLRLHSKRSE